MNVKNIKHKFLLEGRGRVLQIYRQKKNPEGLFLMYGKNEA